MDNNINILDLHIKILRYLLLWPRLSLTKDINKCLLYGYFCLSVLFFTPVIWAVLYQFYVSIDDVNILLEALIAVCDIMGYMVAYVCFLKNKDLIEHIIDDISVFLQYCQANVIQDTDRLCARYTKYMLVYVSIGVTFNLSWPLMSRKYCIDEKGSLFYLRHDPCGMPTHNFYPFDASQSNVFWIVFFVEAIYVCHICFVFSIVTATILGLLMHITAQLKYCGMRIENIGKNTWAKSNEAIKEEFIICVKYHQEILMYAERIFAAFNAVVSAYVIITSFAAAIIGYQIVTADNIQDRLRYMMLLFAWGLLFFLICFHAQKVQDKSIAIANSVYNCEWNITSSDKVLKRYIIMVMMRAHHPLYFKMSYLGIISSSRFVTVMKTAYSFFTILLTVTDKN
uniref:Odorant receptor n=1 Tax=Eucryptorrhynchus brandti TaxID=436910 RepID=A0A8F4MWY0_EUCBR|nr:odorant receptor 22 [Eucryptorrhynchus brandti]